MTEHHAVLKEQEAQLMLTNPHDAFSSQSRYIVLFDMLRYGFLLVCYSKFVLKQHRFQIFDFKKCCDLEIRVRGHSRSFKVVPLHR